MKPLPETLEARIGLRVNQLDTPALVVDLDAMERNIARMADFARKHRVLWRPHAKMHKSAEIALQLQRAGAVGACVQKTAEAEALAAGGVRDITITNQVIAHPKLLRVARLAARLQAQGGRLALAVDSAEGIQRLAEAMAQAAPQARIDVLVEIDVGQGRCGVPPGEPALALAQAVARLTQLRFAGLHAYHGRAQHLHGAAERRDAIAAAVQAARHTRDLLTAAGLPVPLVTGSGTGTLVHEAASGVYGELQAGSFLFMDADYARNEREPAQPAFEQALFVKTQVISACDSHAVCDAGHKSHAIDSGLPTVALLPPGRALRYANGGDEHGLLYADSPQARLPALGQMLWLVPGHCDPTVNLHDFLIGVRGGLATGVVERIIRVDARGALT
ncbi:MULTISPECIES: DSD1 family PLP-dependent enzyme [Acidovorax]|uniref:D-serine deaminase, pyridoxal phosphate-dependent n=1 Tax=Acidovorax soli TaxID=592050 RepID=A0A1H3YJ87_9BURK|nr:MULTISPECIES: DSD1 family PLP-dependent enzyme [Acidovorax]SEA11251.1 D-serine deaminase, pyridoxal phosphate-dependent [Acidovorax soli]